MDIPEGLKKLSLNPGDAIEGCSLQCADRILFLRQDYQIALNLMKEMAEALEDIKQAYGFEYTSLHPAMTALKKFKEWK